MEVSIGNELIASFMGFNHTNHGFEDKYGNVITEPLDYDKDWNHLMDCVEKCFMTQIDGVGHGQIEDALINVYDDKITRVWKACITFIQHKNK